jgi:hypothetical protein
MWAPLAGLYPYLTKNAENRDKTAFESFSSCLHFSAPILTKLTTAQRCYMEVFHNEFYHNLTRSVENTGQITVMPFSASSNAPIFMQRPYATPARSAVLLHRT